MEKEKKVATISLKSGQKKLPILRLRDFK